MKKFVIALALSLIGCGTLGSTSAPKLEIDEQAGGMTSYKLPNGFKIILIPFPSASNTRVELLVKTGSKVEGYGETGMAHLLEHMLFKGAGARANIKEDLTRMGAVYNGTTTTDRTNFFETVSAEPDKVDQVIRLEADRFLRARFTAKDLSSEMTVVRNELENSERQPSSVVMAALNHGQFFWHGYGRPTIGARSDIEATTYEALVRFHRRHYRTDNTALIISGNFDAQRVVTLAAKLFAQERLPIDEKPLNATRDTAMLVTTQTDVYLNAGTSVVASGWKLPSMKEREVQALDLAVTAVCDQDWGSLRQTVVLEKKQAVSAMCSVATDADYSRLLAFARAGQEADVQAMSDTLVKHIEQSAQQGITQAQLERARLAAINAYQRAISDHETVASLVSESEVAGDWRLFLWMQDVVNTVNLQEANTALKKWIVPTNRVDVRLHHSDASPLSFPAPVDANQVIGQQQWASIFTPSDPAPQNLMALAKATKIVSLGQPNIQSALITRRTQGDKVWFVLDNDFGSPTSLRARKTACSAANALIPYGGNGLSRDALSAQMEQDQAVWHVSLDKIYLEVPRINLSHALSTLLGVWSAPTLPRDEFDRYQQAQLAAYQASLKDPVKLADNQLRLRFNNYDAGDWNEPRSLQHLIQATSAMTYDDVVQCSRDFSAMSHARIGVVGNLSEQELQSMWRAVSAPLKAKEGYERTPLPSAPQNVDASAIVVTQPDTPNARVTGLSVIALNSHSPDYPALQLAVFAIGGNSSSLIWQKIREQEGLAYASGMHLVASAFDQRASVELFATASSANASKALLSLQSILDKVIQDGFTPAQIEQAKAIWLEKRKAFLGEESLFAASLASGLYDGQDFLYLAHLDEQLAKLDSVTVTQVLRRYLKPSTFVWATGKGTP